MKSQNMYLQQKSYSVVQWSTVILGMFALLLEHGDLLLLMEAWILIIYQTNVKENVLLSVQELYLGDAAE